MHAKGEHSGRQSGFTLIEVMVAATVLMVGIIGTFSMVDGAARQTQVNNSRTAAVNLAREILEQARSMDYDKLTPAEMITKLRTRPGLAGSTDASGRWVISRRGIQTTITADVCTFDDPMDGLAAIPPTNACPAAQAVAGTPVETNPDDFRRIGLTFVWNVGVTDYQSRQVGMIANPSGGVGPRVLNFDPPFTLQITAGITVPFVATTTASAAVRWSMDDGVHMGDATGGPSIWGFNWDIGTVGVGSWTVDGTYTATVQPFDTRGVPGEARAATVLLNRRIPLAPTGVAGGRSEYLGGVVELEWKQNPERDIIGYRVYRTGSDNIKSRVCPLPAAGTNAVSLGTTCTDTNPGSVPLYTVVAIDRPTLGSPASGVREGDATSFVVTGLGARPLPPTGLVASAVAGRTKLVWNAPAATPAAFYRIYRDGVRIDRTATSDPSFVDPEQNTGTLHTYAVSAVSSTYNESILSATVTAG